MGGVDAIWSCIEQAVELLAGPAAVIVALLLGSVFVWSGVAKFRRPTRASVAMVQFGVLSRPSSRVGRAYGCLEVVLGCWLISGFAGVYALAVATLMFLTFFLLVVRSLARGETFACFCFGSEDDSLSWRTAARNLLFFLLASIGTVGAVESALKFDLDAPQYLEVLAAVAIGLTAVLASKIGPLFAWNRATVEHLRILAEVEE